MLTKILGKRLGENQVYYLYTNKNIINLSAIDNHTNDLIYHKVKLINYEKLEKFNSEKERLQEALLELNNYAIKSGLEFDFSTFDVQDVIDYNEAYHKNLFVTLLNSFKNFNK